MNGYELRARLGEGGMGVVHLAQRPGERPVALKVLRPGVIGDDESRQRLEREVDTLSRVRNRRVAEIVDADPWGQIAYVATRYVPGLTLHEHAQQEGPLSGEDLVWFADCLAEALQAVHAVGVVHRDVKPSNIILEGRTPILIDFGLARVADDSRLTMTGYLLGTPGYLAPEVLLGQEAGESADVHSWAATVAFAALGRAPYGRGPSMAVMDRVRRGEHDLDGLDEKFAALLEAALAVDPDDRPDLEECRDWLRDLDRGGVLGPVAGGAPASPGAERAPVTMPYAQWHDDRGAESPSAPEPEAAPGTRVLEGDEPLATRRDTWHSEWTEQQPEWSDWSESAPRAPRAGLFERTRRATILLAACGVVAGAAAMAPWVTLAALSVAVWIVRAGSLTASSVERRRYRRGARWWDPVSATLAAPWHFLGAVPGAGLLLLWSIGVGASAALLCFALGLGAEASLAVVGAATAAGVWWGPGRGRFAGPVARVSDALSAKWPIWLLATVLLVVLGWGMYDFASLNGANWAPGADRPFAGVRLPNWL